MSRRQRPGSFLSSLIACLLILAAYWLFGGTDQASIEFNPIASEEAATQASPESSRNIYQAVVVRVVDGDTVIVTLDGEEVRVRLSGVDTPESVGDYKDDPQPYGPEASAYTGKLLWQGRMIYLEEDVKVLDRYERYLFYVWLEDPRTSSLEEACLNAMLLKEGYGVWFDDYDNRAYARAFEALEKSAHASGKGIWK